ncbi:hypothetical protein D9M68_804820 [compost metagenome]
MRSRSLSCGLLKKLRRIIARYLALACTLFSSTPILPTPTLRAAAGVICIKPVAPPTPRAAGSRVDSLNASAARVSQSKPCCAACRCSTGRTFSRRWRSVRPSG